MPLKFVNDVVRPWSELNAFLANRFALPPNNSRVTRNAVALAVAIKHQAEAVSAALVPSLAAVKPHARGCVVNAESHANMLMSDVADAAKHATSLRRAGRKNELRVLAEFEFDNLNRFRFLRNKIVVTHATHGEFDFMVESANAIGYWLETLGVNGPWDGVLAIGPNEFNETAFLYYHPDHQVVMQSVNLSFQQRAPSGELVATDPLNVIFAVYDHPDCQDRKAPSAK